MVPDPLPWQVEEPRVPACSLLLSQPVAVAEAHAGRPEEEEGEVEREEDCCGRLAWMCLWGRVATWTNAPAPIRTAAADSPMMTGPWLSRARMPRQYLAGQLGFGGGEPSAIPS